MTITSTIAAVTDRPQYSLALSEEEITRYRYMAETARAEEAVQWQLAGIRAGARIADIGCGPGLTTIELADIAGPSGRVVAVDREQVAADTARALLDQRGLTAVEVRVGPAWDTGLAPESFDVVNIRHVLAHNITDDRRRILEHAFALLVPGGSLYLVDADMTGSRVDPPDPDILDLQETYARHLLDSDRDAMIGPSLGSATMAAGFEVVERHVITAMPPAAVIANGVRPPGWAAREAMLASGHATPADVERWDAALTRFAKGAESGVSWLMIPMYTVVARKPRG